MTDSVEAPLVLPLTVGAPGDARCFIRWWLANGEQRELANGEQRELAELLVSELVTNAVSYSRGRVELVVRDLGAQTRVEVSDESVTLPVIRAPELEGGRGLHLVEAIADRWRVEERIDGKSVWFEISAGKDALQNRERGVDCGGASGSGSGEAGPHQPAPPDAADAAGEAGGDRRDREADGAWLRCRWHHPAGRR